MPRKPLTRGLLALGTCLSTCWLALPTAMAGEVEVSFVKPDEFADAGRNAIDRERMLKALAGYLQSLGRTLPAGQTLKLEVTDLDLAGNVEPFGWYASHEVRVLRGRADWPHLNLRYTLQAEGRTLKAGDAFLADISYMYSLRGRDRPQDELAYEKRMVRRWFEATFPAP